MAALVTGNVVYDLANQPLPLALQNHLVDHCLLEILCEDYGDGLVTNHAELRLVFRHTQVNASPYAPANTQSLRMDLQARAPLPSGVAPGAICITTATFRGAHTRARVSHVLPIRRSRKFVRDFINLVRSPRLNLLPCDYTPAAPGAHPPLFACRDFT
jgi:hypothetical protein